MTNNDDMENGAYIKTWVGELVPQSSYESAHEPRGGGWGNVTNILFQNFHVQGVAGYAAAISQNSGDNGSYQGTSNMLVSNVTFANFSGYLLVDDADATTLVSCSTRNPCHDITFVDFALEPSEDAGYEVGATGTCTYIADEGVVGISGNGC